MQKIAHLAGIGFATIFGFSFMFSKLALAYISPMGLIAYRFLLAFLIFEALRLFKIIHIRFQKSHMKALFLVALCQPIAYFLFETYGVARTASGEAGMMIALIPIFVTLFGAIILKEKPTLLQFLMILLSVSGIFYIQLSKANEGFQIETLGFLLLFFAILSAALFNIASRNAAKSLKPYEITYFMMMAGAFVFNLLYVVQLLMQGELANYFSHLMTTDVWVSILYLGIVASIGGFFLVNFALGQLPPHVASIYSNIATIVAIAAGAIILKEQIYPYHLIGGAMIIIGVYGTVRINHLKTTLNTRDERDKTVIK